MKGTYSKKFRKNCLLLFDVLLLLSKNYLKIAVISCLLGSLLTFYLMTGWLQNFAFAIRLGFADFFIPLIASSVFYLSAHQAHNTKSHCK